MDRAEPAARRTTLQQALGNRAGRLQEAQYDALIVAQYDTPEALLDASEVRLEKVLQAPGAVDAVLAWQKETKAGGTVLPSVHVAHAVSPHPRAV